MSHYLRLVKFHYHLSYVSVVFGAAIFAEGLPLALLKSLLWLYLSFNVLLYGGVYTLNDIADTASDEKHPAKRLRPLPAKRISLKSALTFSALMLAAGFVSIAALFDRAIFAVCFVIVGLNIFYSFYARNVPYLELLINSSTYPLRFLMGAFLAGSKILFTWLPSFF